MRDIKDRKKCSGRVKGTQVTYKSERNDGLQSLETSMAKHGLISFRAVAWFI